MVRLALGILIVVSFALAIREELRGHYWRDQLRNDPLVRAMGPSLVSPADRQLLE